MELINFPGPKRSFGRRDGTQGNPTTMSDILDKKKVFQDYRGFPVMADEMNIRFAFSLAAGFPSGCS